MDEETIKEIARVSAANDRANASEPPTAWDDLFEALTLLRRSHPQVISPFNCAHDTLWVSADPADFTAEELTRLNVLGFFPSGEDGVPGFMSFRFGSA